MSTWDVPTFQHVYWSCLLIDQVHVLKWKPSDGLGMSFEQRQVRIVQRRLRSERSRVRGVHVHVQQRVSGDGIGMHERRRQVRIVQHRVLSERYHVCSVHVHVQQRVSGDGIGMHE